MTALAFAMLAPARRVAPLAWPRQARFRIAATGLLAAIIALQFTAAGLLAEFAFGVRGTATALERQPLPPALPAGTCSDFPNEAWRGDIGLALAFIRALTAVKENPAARDSDATIRTLDYFVCVANARDLRDRARPLLRAGLLFRAELAYNPAFESLRERFAPALDNWEFRVREYLLLSPFRTDLVLPFFSWSLARGEHRKVLGMVDEVLTRNPGDPVALWFKGMALLAGKNLSNRNNALNYLRKGIRSGIEKWLPIDEDLKRAIDRAGAATRRAQ